MVNKKNFLSAYHDCMHMCSFIMQVVDLWDKNYSWLVVQYYAGASLLGRISIIKSISIHWITESGNITA